MKRARSPAPAPDWKPRSRTRTDRLCCNGKVDWEALPDCTLSSPSVCHFVPRTMPICRSRRSQGRQRRLPRPRRVFQNGRAARSRGCLHSGRCGRRLGFLDDAGASVEPAPAAAPLASAKASPAKRDSGPRRALPPHPSERCAPGGLRRGLVLADLHRPHRLAMPLASARRPPRDLPARAVAGLRSGLSALRGRMMLCRWDQQTRCPTTAGRSGRAR